TGAEELLYADDMPKSPSSWSRNGRFLLYTADSPKMLSDIWVLSMTQESGAPAKPYQWLHTQFAEQAAVFSPDGKWVAYQSNEWGTTRSTWRRSSARAASARFRRPAGARLAGQRRATRSSISEVTTASWPCP